MRFEPDEALRLTGRHYRDMYLITAGEVEVRRDIGRGFAIGPGSPIGEIGFLRSCPATATVIAKTAVDALVVDDATLARLEGERPVLAAQLLQVLANIAEERTSHNLTFAAASSSYAKAPRIVVSLCRDRDVRESAMRLRYEVYCDELGRQSPFADHERRILTDALDDRGDIFIATEAGEVIGTLRLNLCREGSLDGYEELYGMRASPHHPKATAICTKFVVKKSKRRGPAALKLVAAVARHCARSNLRECYIDCIPSLLPYYKAMGFKLTGPKFFHRENGPSYPMKIDVVKYADLIGRKFGMFPYLRLYAKAKAIKWFDKLVGNQAMVAQS